VLSNPCTPGTGCSVCTGGPALPSGHPFVVENYGYQTSTSETAGFRTLLNFEKGDWYENAVSESQRDGGAAVAEMSDGDEKRVKS